MKIILVNCSLRIEFESNICSKSYLFIGNSYIYTTDFKQIIIIEAKYFREFFLDSLRSKKSPQQQILMYMPWIRSYDIHYILFLLLVDNIQLLHWKASHQIPGVHSEFITHVKLWTKITDIHNNACISRQLHFDTLKLGTIAKERHLCWTPSNSIELFG